jgi:hypothetical protein
MVRTSAAGLAATAVLVSATVAGCGSDGGSSATSTTASSSVASSSAPATSSTSAGANPATPSDYGNLLIKPSDIGPQATADGPPISEPRRTDRRGPDVPEPGAAPMIPAMKDELGRKITGAQQPVDTGSNGFMVAGVAADPSKQMEISEVVFIEGRTLVDLEFDCSLAIPRQTTCCSTSRANKTPRSRTACPASH